LRIVFAVADHSVSQFLARRLNLSACIHGPQALIIARHVPAFVTPVDHLDAGEPLHLRHSVPTGHDQAQRESMLRRQRLAVHREGQQVLGRLRILNVNAAAMRGEVCGMTGRWPAPRRRDGFVSKGYKWLRFVRVGARKWVRLVFSVFRAAGGRRWHDWR